MGSCTPCRRDPIPPAGGKRRLNGKTRTFHLPTYDAYGVLLVFQRQAFAYTDPGTGLLAIQAAGSALVQQVGCFAGRCLLFFIAVPRKTRLLRRGMPAAKEIQPLGESLEEPNISYLQRIRPGSDLPLRTYRIW